jgi:hypothetical protein
MSNGTPSPPLITIPVPYNPADWYWKIGAETQVYYSRTNVRINTSDSDYTAWVNAGNVATPIATEAELFPVLNTALPTQFPAWLFDGTTFIQPSVNNFTPKQIKGYAGDVRWTYETGGLKFRAHPINTDREAQAQLGVAGGQARNNAAFTAQWKCSDGTFYAVDAPTMIALASAAEDWVNKCFSTEQTIIQTATTKDQVNAAFAALSNVYT